MDGTRINEVVKELQAGDSAGVPFEQKRTELLNKGYSEQEIIQGVYRFPYDGKPNAPQPADPMKSFYRQHPEAVDALSKSLLNDLAKQEREKLLADTAASMVGDKQTTSYYEVQTADDVGFPFYTAFFITLIVGAVAYKFKWLNYAPAAISTGASLYFGYLWYRLWRATRSRK